MKLIPCFPAKNWQCHLEVCIMNLWAVIRLKRQTHCEHSIVLVFLDTIVFRKPTDIWVTFRLELPTESLYHPKLSYWLDELDRMWTMDCFWLSFKRSVETVSSRKVCIDGWINLCNLEIYFVECMIWLQYLPWQQEWEPQSATKQWTRCHEQRKEQELPEPATSTFQAETKKKTWEFMDVIP